MRYTDGRGDFTDYVNGQVDAQRGREWLTLVTEWGESYRYHQSRVRTIPEPTCLECGQSGVHAHWKTVDD